MVNYQDVVRLLAEKRTYFLSYETVTETMLACSIDDLEACMEERVRLIEKIDRIDEAVESLIAGDRDPALLREVVRCRCNRGDLNDVTGAVYDAAAAVRSVISRIPDIEVQVDSRLIRERERLLELIKSTNRGMEAQAARFSTGQDTGGRFLNISKA